MEPPNTWPKEVISNYEAVNFLGKGGFASVVLAKKRDDSTYVAMKVVAARTDTESSYAHREMNILSDLSHPNIMKVLQHWEISGNSAAIMALSYHPGMTLENILETKGAPSLNFCRIVLAQLVDAISYLHSHAVLHRDIKPDNMIIEHCSIDQTEIWDGEQPTLEEEKDDNTTASYWNNLRSKYHLVLIDFGFARALSKTEVETSERNVNQFKEDNKKKSISRLISFGRRSSRDYDDNDNSINHKLMRRLSAVGNRRYAAPEIINGVYEDDTSIRTRKKKKSNTVSEYVSDYSMVVDAFSLGVTMRQVLSGVPPEQSIEDAITMRNIAKISSLFCCCNTTAKKIIRSEFPKDALTLIRGLTHGNPKKRTTVSNARLHPYINDVLLLADDDKREQKSTTIQYLACASHINDALDEE